MIYRSKTHHKLQISSINRQIKHSENIQITNIRQLIKGNSNKLSANDLIKLKQPLYKDYLRNLKGYAKKQQQKVQQQRQRQCKSTRQYIKSNEKQFHIDINHNQNIKISKNVINMKYPSYYYSEKNQILSFKQFMILVQQSRRKNQIQRRKSQRQKDKQLIDIISRKIQSAGNTTNIRLTSSYAKKIKKMKSQAIDNDSTSCNLIQK